MAQNKVAKLAVEARDGVGKGAARAARRNNQVPGVIYGNKEAPIAINIDPKILTMTYHSGGFFTKLLDLELGGKAIRTLPRDIQVHPVTENILHADFMRVTDKTRIRVSIPVHVKNEAKCPGLKAGGVLNIVEHAIEVTCMANAIPAYFEVDVDGLEIGDSVHIKDLKLPEGVKPVIQDRNFTVVAVNPPTVVKEETPVAAAAATAEGAAPAEGAAAAPGATPAAGAAAPAAGDAKGAAAKPAAPAKK